jgi:hypothetical protein
MSRITTAQLAQIVAQQGEAIGQIVALLSANTTPATVVTAITEAPTARTRKGAKHTVKSFAAGEALAATGVSPSSILVPKGKFGREGTQTLAQAQAKRAEADAAREAYLAERGNVDEADVEARKTSNRELAAWLRANKLPANGDVWAAAKNGETSVSKLRKLA